LAGFDIRDRANWSCEPAAFAFCVPAGDCAKPDASNKMKCLNETDRYAILPFEGELSFRAPNPRDSFRSTRIQWDICCGCAALPTPPEASNDKCPSTADADAFAQQNRQERQAKKTELEDAWKEYEKEMAEANKHRADFETTMSRCKIQQAATKILILIAGFFGPGGAALGAEGVAAEHEIEAAL